MQQTSMASSSASPSKRSLIAPACPVCIMPLFFCWVEGVNCVVRGSLALLHPSTSDIVHQPQLLCRMAAILCPSHPPHYKGLAKESVPWLLSSFVCVPCAALLTGLVLTAESEHGDGESKLWVLQGLVALTLNSIWKHKVIGSVSYECRINLSSKAFFPVYASASKLHQIFHMSDLFSQT